MADGQFLAPLPLVVDAEKSAAQEQAFPVRVFPAWAACRPRQLVVRSLEHSEPCKRAVVQSAERSSLVAAQSVAARLELPVSAPLDWQGVHSL
jgi:DNA primase